MVLESLMTWGGSHKQPVKLHVDRSVGGNQEPNYTYQIFTDSGGRLQNQAPQANYTSTDRWVQAIGSQNFIPLVFPKTNGLRF
eukprot:11071381-Prorocentrum_lima.AAC.1